MNKDNYHSHKREHWNSYLFVKKAVKYQQRKKKWKKPKRFVWRLKKEKNAQTHVMHKNKKYEKRYSNCKFFEQRIFMKLLKYIRKSLYILQLRFLFFWSQRLVPIFTNPLTDFHSNARKGLSAYKPHCLIVNYHRFPHRDERKDENHRCLEIEWISQPRLPDSIVLLKHCHWRNYSWVKVRRFHYRSYCISNERCSVTVFCLALCLTSV